MSTVLVVGLVILGIGVVAMAVSAVKNRNTPDDSPVKFDAGTFGVTALLVGLVVSGVGLFV